MTEDEDQIFVMIILQRLASHPQVSAVEQHSDHHHDSDERPATIRAVDKERTVRPTCVLFGSTRLDEIPDDIMVSMDLGHEEHGNRPLTFKGEWPRCGECRNLEKPVTGHVAVTLCFCAFLQFFGQNKVLQVKMES